MKRRWRFFVKWIHNQEVMHLEDQKGDVDISIQFGKCRVEKLP